MSKQNNGGPAFPRIEPGDSDSGPKIYFGASLRDYFAAKAMQAISRNIASAGTDLPDSVVMPEVARAAYEMADAMLAERAK